MESQNGDCQFQMSNLANGRIEWGWNEPLNVLQQKVTNQVHSVLTVESSNTYGNSLRSRIWIPDQRGGFFLQESGNKAKAVPTLAMA